MKFVCAQAQGMYWFLVMRAGLGARRGDLDVVRGRRIGAAPFVELGLRRLLIEAGIDPQRNQVAISPVPGSLGLKVNTGVTVAQALEDGIIDGFWANGMGAEIAVQRGIGTIVLDVRRGDGPKVCFDYTFPGFAVADGLIESEPDTVAAAVRAIVATQAALKRDVSLATEVGRRLFPPENAALIARLIERDLPYYDAAISRRTVEVMNAFARDFGLLSGHPRYEDVVAPAFTHLWNS
jgi:ABC-type nitrate/sulfonate/bicarbonate transport system substrate-binding protein